ncbi:dihydrodipicolinate reductase [Hydrogenoanaerobacterium saccharovorans]|uniref:4-hydroxy-tetrahydrodipicolinate reductase n=1 Tax=Hydrogenoanaerobacterium saccharovorans TaxID=474960 RepID=A0A1H7ZM88_9FIRM|nr:4-hydroxy-tetrahydrodipicolinate reductase [Hydrogenoanaerobacterium saccharovorans]RPF48508.1 dihydrodipicolinate reductase [Hydrogenoanaerobacterium saccharovorans]SEM59490.1 dihydrodipicolinate reductase [Hydrogenoanaerobacterium saccharovorans]
MKKIILSGANGKMGHVIASFVKEKDDCEIVAGIDINTTQYDDFPIFAAPAQCNIKADCIIDFSHPSLLNSMLEYAVHTSTPIVVATTGLSSKQIALLRKTSELVPVFFSFNMSLGVNLLAELAKKAATILGHDFDIEIVEKHHNQKVDAPSGTAIMLADAINHAQSDCYEYVYDRHSKREKRSKNEIGMHSIRGGTIVGEHDVIFAGKDEVITLSHSAMSKEIFATGAVNAALYLAGKNAGLYDMGDLVRMQNVTE